MRAPVVQQWTWTLETKDEAVAVTLNEATRKLARDGMDKGESLRAVLGLGNGPPTWTAEQPESMPLAELASRLPQVEFNPEMIHRVMDLKLIKLSKDGSEVVVRS